LESRSDHRLALRPSAATPGNGLALASVWQHHLWFLLTDCCWFPAFRGVFDNATGVQVVSRPGQRRGFTTGRATRPVDRERTPAFQLASGAEVAQLIEFIPCVSVAILHRSIQITGVINNV
jgi:hypothetical protein